VTCGTTREAKNNGMDREDFMIDEEAKKTIMIEGVWK
jgi:hypothetical protein